MKLGVSNIAWTSQEDEKVYKIMKENNFRYLEIAPTRFFENEPYCVEDSLVFNKKIELETKGLSVISLQSLIFEKPNYKLFGTKSERENLKNYIKKSIEFAIKIGAKNLVFGNPKNRSIYKNYNENFVFDFFNEVGEYAFENNVFLSIEANPRIYGTNFLNTTQEAFDFVRKINNKGIKLQIDTGTITMNNENIEKIYDMINYINHFHISEPFLEKIPENKIDLYCDIMKKMTKLGYEKCFSIEMKNINYKNKINVLENIMKKFNKNFHEN